MEKNEVPRTQIAIRLQQAMDQEGLTIQDAAKKFKMTYEYVRRLTRGINNPSTTALQLFSNHFGWDYAEMEKLLVQDRFRVRNGDLGAMAQELNPEVQPFERGWHLLEQAQKDKLVADFNLFLAQNRRHIRGGIKPSDDAPTGGKK